MKKSDEITLSRSCFNRAGIHERIFVLLARDVAAPVAIRAWVEERLRLGKNKLGDPQVLEALNCADLMEQERSDQ